MYQPVIGHRVRVIRYRPDGRAHFNKTGTITNVFSTGYMWHDDVHGASSLAGCEFVAALMAGWSQTIERLPDADDEPENECESGDCLGIHRSPDGHRDCDGKSI